MQSHQKYTNPHQHSLLYYTFLYTEHNGNFRDCLMFRLFHFIRGKGYKWMLASATVRVPVG